MRGARTILPIVADDDHERPRRQRNEGLAAEGMTLDHRKLEGERIGCAPGETNEDMGVRPRGLVAGVRTVALRHPSIDWEVIVGLRIDHVAEFGEVFAGQRLCGDNPGHAVAAFIARRGNTVVKSDPGATSRIVRLPVSYAG